jgi:adenosylcobyric acid synthase
MWHGSLESDGFRQAFLGEVAATVGRRREPSTVSFEERREARLDLLGDLVSEHLDVEALLGLVLDGVPAGLPLLPPGSAR